MRLEELAGLLPGLGALADACARGHDEQHQVVPPSLFGAQEIVAQAKAVFAALASETEGRDGRVAAGSEQVNGIAVPLGFEELPYRSHLHEAYGFLLYFFYLLVERQGFLLALSQGLFKIAFVAEMAAVEHVGIDIAPQLGQIGDLADAAVEIWRRGNGDVGADFCASAGG